MHRARPRFGFLIALVVVGAACTEPAEVVPAGVVWLEWPAEALVAAPFRMRLLIPSLDCGVIAELAIPVRAETAAVRLEPRYTVLQRRELWCFAAPGLGDTAIAVAIEQPGSFTLQALALPFPGEVTIPEAPALQLRDFGTIVTRTDSAATIENAAGIAAFFTDPLGCQRVTPFPIYSTPTGEHVSPGSYPLDSTDTAIPPYVRSFVTGTVRRAPVAVCGDTVVFHLIGR